MKNSGIYILLLILLAASSCRKEEVIIDREDALSPDTSFMIYKVQYNSHTPTSLNLTVDMLQLNGAVSESAYSGATYVDAMLPNKTITFSSANPYIHPDYGSYSTIFVYDYAETESYAENFAGFCLRRFFEIVDSLPNRNVALSSFSFEENNAVRLHVENPGDIFGNTWEYNVDQFYEYTTQNDYDANATSGQYLESILTSLMDSLVAAPNATGDLSITLLTGNGGYNFSNSADLESISDKAVQNNIRINVISPGGGSDLTQLAHETGGFISKWIGDENGDPLPDDQQIKNVQIALQNLDDLLMGEVTTHRTNFTVVTTNTWNSGQSAFIQFIYKDHLFDILMRIP